MGAPPDNQEIRILNDLKFFNFNQENQYVISNMKPTSASSPVNAQ